MISIHRTSVAVGKEISCTYWTYWEIYWERVNVSTFVKRAVYGLKLLTTNSPKDHAKGNSQGEVRYHMKLSSSCGTDRNFF